MEKANKENQICDNCQRSIDGKHNGLWVCEMCYNRYGYDEI